MSSAFDRVRALFEGASRLAPADRDAYLDRECGDDTALRAEVASLLAAAAEDDGFLGTDHAAALGAGLAGSAAPLAPGARVGPFRLLRILGTGGMGIVYEAEQGSPRRRVALKMMRVGLESEQATRRFRYEAEIIASLRHPSIAPIFATGVHTEGGLELPWFAMEYVEGARSIVDHAEAEGLSLEQRLEVFRAACDAVHHGHVKGVVHRDLKPDNILVDAGGLPRVIDFGIARVTDSDLALSTLQTQEGAVVGTLATMSPEQVAGDRDALDLRTDVYSLGVVLYRLLTGTFPHELAGVSLPEAARRINQEAPTRPSDHDPRLSGDLETILLKALEKEPERRYRSAAQLADDLRRHLAGEAILARPPSVAYQARVFARRHRALVAALSAIAVVSVAAALVSYRSAREAEDAAEDATRRFGIVRDVGHDLLHDVLAQLEGLPGATGARASIAATATAYLAALEQEAGDDVEVLHDLQVGYHALGTFQGAPGDASLGETQRGAGSLERSLAMAARVLELEPAHAAAREEAVATRVDLGALYLRLGRAEEGSALLGEAIDEARARGFARQEFDALLELAEVHRDRGAHGDAAARLEEALGVLEHLEGDVRRDTGLVRSRLGAVAVGRQDWDVAEPHLLAWRSTAGELAAEAPLDVEARNALLDSVTFLSRLEARRGAPEPSLSYGEEAVALGEDLVASDPNDARARTGLANALDARGAARLTQRDLGGGLADWERSLALFEQNLAVDSGDLAARTAAVRMRVKTWSVRADMGELAEATSALRAAVADMEEVLAIDPGAVEREAVLSWALEVLVHTLIRRQEFGEAALVVERFRAVAQAGADRAPEDSYSQRQMLLVLERVGLVQGALADDASLPVDERMAGYGRAAEAYGDCLEVFEHLREKGFLNPGDEGARSHVQRELERVAGERARLEAERAP